MHPAGLFGKRVEEAQAAAKPLPDLLRLAKGAITRAFLLARVGEPVATSTCEQITACIELCDPSTAIASIGIDRACEPWASAAEVAAGPCDGDVLPNVFPLGFAVTARAIDENHGVILDLDPDVAVRLAVA
jgi:hypothetical protein